PAYAHPRSYVAAVGRLVPQKGFDVLLEAFARLDAPEVDLLIAGDGPERRRLEALRERLGLGARVHLLGAVDRATVASLYRGARLVACPSRWEGLPLVCLEAMASGRAVVASRVDGIPDAVGDGETGLLVPPEDPVVLAAALGALLEDGPRRERRAGRRRARGGARGVCDRRRRRRGDVRARARAPPLSLPRARPGAPAAPALRPEVPAARRAPGGRRARGGARRGERALHAPLRA